MTTYVHTFTIDVDELATIYKHAATVDKSEVVGLGFVLCAILNGYDRLSGAYTFNLSDLHVGTFAEALGRNVNAIIDVSALASTSSFGCGPTVAEIEALIKRRRRLDGAE